MRHLECGVVDLEGDDLAGTLNTLRVARFIDLAA
jgi:hypothetical protein